MATVDYHRFTLEEIRQGKVSFEDFSVDETSEKAKKTAKKKKKKD